MLWLLALIVVLLLIAALFGGFQKGTRVSGASIVSAAATP
jgi:hypothetical protein